MQFTRQTVAQLIDHTLLKAEATDKQILNLCDEALEHGFFGVCVNSSYLPLAVSRLEKSAVVPVAVVGFPLGAMSTAAKVFETKFCCDAGAQEIDVVVNLGFYFSGRIGDVAGDLGGVVKAAGRVPVKVILETSYLKPEQIKDLTWISTDAGAAFVKTSTGFAARGASVEDILLMREALAKKNLVEKIGIKASGGIRDLASLQRLVEAGATRVGASASVSIVDAASD